MRLLHFFFPCVCVCGGVTLRLACGGLGPHVCELSICSPASTAFYPVSMVSPLKADVFARELSNHPDQTKVSFCKGCFIHISRGVYPLCALQSVMDYLAIKGNSSGPLFLLQDGRPLSRPLLTNWMTQILARAGVPGNFSSHSFRIGAATVAARRGIPDHVIQALGRWSSNTYQLYIRMPAEALANLSCLLTPHS